MAVLVILRGVGGGTATLATPSAGASVCGAAAAAGASNSLTSTLSEETIHGVCVPFEAWFTCTRTPFKICSIVRPGWRISVASAEANGLLGPLPSGATVLGADEKASSSPGGTPIIVRPGGTGWPAALPKP